MDFREKGRERGRETQRERERERERERNMDVRNIDQLPQVSTPTRD